MDLMPRFLAALMAAVLAAILGGCSANGTGGVNVGGANAASRIKAAPLVNLAISPTHLDAGGFVTVTWSSTNATACVGTGALAGNLAIENDNGMPVAADKIGTWTYGIQCHGPGGVAAASVIVTVGVVPAPTIDIYSFPPVIRPGDVANLVWDTVNAQTCQASGGTGADGWGGGVAIDNIQGFATQPIPTVGDYSYTLTCVGPGGTTTASRIVSVTTATPDAPPTLNFAATPAELAPGDSTVLTWSTSNATTCGAGGGSGNDGWIGLEPTASAGTTIGPINSVGTYVYTIGCLGPGGSVAKTITVIVSQPDAPPPAVAVQIDASPTTIVAGAAANLTWSTQNADSCVASGSWGGGQALLGETVSTGVIALPGLYTYTLLCTGPSGTATASANVNVTAGVPSITGFSATPTTITAGGNVSLSWTASGADSCTASGGTGTDGWSGTVATSSSGDSVGPLSVPGTYTYTLLCTGPGGPSAPQSVNVTVNAANPAPASVTSFTATPSTITAGAASSLTWNTTGATSCTGSGGTGSDGWTGPQGTSSSGTSTGPITVPGSYTYRLTCTGPGGAGVASTAVVNVNPAPLLPAVVSAFTASPSNIQTGQSASLDWVSIGASSCTASGGTGSDNWGGSVSTTSTGNTVTTGIINTAGTYTYTLQCNGSGGTGAAVSVTVNVTNPPGSAAAITAFTATPTTVVAGGTTSLAWTTSNATACTATGGTGADGWGGTVAASSANTVVGPLASAGTVTYNLACNGPGGASSTSSVSVNVVNALPLPTISVFTATPGTITTGQSTSLTWASAGATSCAATGGTGSDGWVGTKTPAATVSVGPINTAGTYTYTLTCTGPGGTGSANSVVLNVNAVTPPAATVTSLLATPSTVLTGQSSVLTWTSDSATSCAASGGTGAGADGWAGSVGTSSVAYTVGPFTTPGAYTYTLTCSGAGGTGAPQSVTVDVVNTPAVPVVGVFAALPTTVTTGTPITLNWVTVGATSCTASGGTGSDNWSGTVAASNVGFTTGPLTPAGSYTYTLTCTGAGGTSTPNSVNVTVTDAPTAPSIQAFLATPPAVQTGGSTLLSWTALGANSCVASGGTGNGDNWGGVVNTTSVGVSVGPITPAGTYTYTLTCTGAGGTTSSSQTVTATTAIPPANISTFTALPSTISTGQSILLTWVSAGATACTASGGTGSDGWNGSQPTVGTAVPIGPINTAGTYVYTLNCTGPGGASTPQSVTVTVNPATPAAAITAFSAVPSTITVNQSSALVWTTTNATSCTATGGTGSDNWNGAVGATSIGRTVGPLTTAATVSYTLTCTGPGGTSAPATTSVTVNPAAAVQPTVTLSINGSNPTTIQPGSAPTLTWSSSNATSCVGAGGTGLDGWAGAKATSSNPGQTLGAISTPGVYTYTLSCIGAGGSATATAQLTVIVSASADCGLPSLQTTALLAPSASVSSSISGTLCVLCGVSNATNVITASATTPASLNVLLGALGGTAVLDVKNGSAYPAGRQVGFTIAEGNQLLSLTLLNNITVTTYYNGAQQETANSSDNLLGLQAVGLLSINANAGFAGFTTTKPFDEVSIQEKNVAGLLNSLSVYRACVSLR